MLEYMYFPHDISTFGPKIDLLFEIIFWLVLVVWVLVMITMVTFMIRYRNRPGRKAEYIEGNHRHPDRSRLHEPLDLGRHQGAWAAGRRVLPGDRKAVQLGNHLPRTR